MHFYDIVSPAELLHRLVEDSDNVKIASGIASLLLDSFYPQDVEQLRLEGVCDKEGEDLRDFLSRIQLERCIKLAHEDISGCIALYYQMRAVLPLNTIAKFILNLFIHCSARMEHLSSARKEKAAPPTESLSEVIALLQVLISLLLSLHDTSKQLDPAILAFLGKRLQTNSIFTLCTIALTGAANLGSEDDKALVVVVCALLLQCHAVAIALGVVEPEEQFPPKRGKGSKKGIQSTTETTVTGAKRVEILMELLGFSNFFRGSRLYVQSMLSFAIIESACAINCMVRNNL